MLNKVLKYDFKRLGKTLLPLYLITILMGFVNYGFSLLGTKHFLFQIPGALIMFAFILLLIATFLGTFVMSIRHFYITMLSDEGYLTNTLPVTKNTLITSKLITTLVFTLISIVVIFLAVWIGFLQSFNLVELLIKVIETDIIYKMTDATNMIGLIMIIILMVIAYILQWFFFIFAISLGHTKSEKRWMFSMLFGMLLYFFQQMAALFTTGCVVIYALLTKQIFINGVEAPPTIIGLLLGISMLLYITLIAVYWLGTNAVFKNRLNLE